MRRIARSIIMVSLVVGAWTVPDLVNAQPPTGGGQVSVDTLQAASEEREAARALGRVGGFLKDLFGISPEAARTKLIRIAFISLIWLIAVAVMRLIRTINRWIVYSEWGPLRYLFLRHQRSLTLNSLMISLLKYAVYLTAFGYVLRELGVNYKAYLASLSLIGIAVGFGSQGLVQDVVTGFFLLFESQFSVGDMVEISGQFGIVQEIGLRATRLRNYLGELVVLPNRSILVVGKFVEGAVEACVDVAVASKDAARRAAPRLLQIGKELEKQFAEIILETPEVVGPISLETGEFFVRLRAKIWPAQQWVIESQMVPRIREIFKREGIEIPGDRVVFFYHLPGGKAEKASVVRGIRRLLGQRSRSASASSAGESPSDDTKTTEA